ncbi:PAQR family membrane homeostasis protein TrhA [Pseudodesulfovibrio sp.]|uniref:PAQR family membrane homeostasis protein TrhA n=1 Tax=unclassified Pseudodesulfovibrio TaxID=2661612 RepID=UPI003B00ED2F
MVISLRDPVSGLTHLIGAVLAVLATVLLVVRVSSPAMPWHIVTFSIFGGAMILLYTASTLYHWLPVSEKWVRFLRRVDHSMIFCYIAATYTPICLIPLRGPWGWSIFGVIWGLALGGIAMKVFWLNAPRWFSTAVYLAMGWLVLVGIYPLVRELSPAALAWLAVGGLVYSAGAVIYALRRPDPWPKKFGFHEIFHLFVIGGSFCHFVLMYWFI